MDRFDREILEFVLAWAPYGGACNEEAFPEFGMSARELRNRFSQILTATAGRPVRLSDDDRQLLDRARCYELSCRARRDTTDARQINPGVRILPPTRRPARKRNGSPRPRVVAGRCLALGSGVGVDGGKGNWEGLALLVWSGLRLARRRTVAMLDPVASAAIGGFV